MGKTGVLILGAGEGRRMQGSVPKQFLTVQGKPLFLYSIEAYLPYVDFCVFVTRREDTEMCSRILSKAGLSEKTAVIAGGKERFDSSYAGLLYLEKCGGFDTVLIHDAARPCVFREVILNVLSDTEKYGASAAAVPSKNTVKVADENGFVKETPDRRTLFVIQTPQGFRMPLILRAYECFMTDSEKDAQPAVTDDAMLIERYTDCPVKLSAGDYRNLKVTTPEDLNAVSEILLKMPERKSAEKL